MTKSIQVCLFTSLLTLLALGVMASTEDVDDEKTDTTEVVINKYITSPLDSLTADLFKQTAADSIQDTTWIHQTQHFADSVYTERIQMIPSEIDLTYNKYVKAFINLYANERRQQVSRMLGLKELYFPYIGQVLDKKNMPHMLKYLPVVESALNPNAVSRMGATGLWQIMYSTGRFLDMDINSYIDERRDPYLATQKATDYLKGLYKVYDDWLLVIAAYNCGPGNVNKAIYRSGGHYNYWKIRRWLPRETRGYVPAFIAATYVMEYHKKHDIPAAQPKFSFLNLDTIQVQKRTEFSAVTKYTGVSQKELAFLNPSVKKQIVPASFGGYSLRLPLDVVKAFETNRDSIFNYSQQLVAQKNEEEEEEKGSESSGYSGPGEDMTKIYYTVKNGDNLGYIAEWFDCKAQEIRNWNGMYGSRIMPGQKIKVYVPEDKVSFYKKVNNLSFSQKQAVERKQRNGEKVTEMEATPTQTNEKCDCTIYTVKSGDTLWDIARKYESVSTGQIKRDNNIRYSGAIKPGMKLKIRE